MKYIEIKNIEVSKNKQIELREEMEKINKNENKIINQNESNKINIINNKDKKENKDNIKDILNKEDITKIENITNNDYLVLNIVSENKDKKVNLSNRKTKRDENIDSEEKESIFNVYNQNNKKQKLENIQNSTDLITTNQKNANFIFDNNNDKNFFVNAFGNMNSSNFNNIIINNNNNIIIKENINKHEKPKYIFSLNNLSKNNGNGEENDKEKELGIIVFQSKKNERSIMRYFKSYQISHEISCIHTSNFPYDCSRLINIKNEAYIIGGKNNNDSDDLGNKFCFKINYINNNNNDGLGEIKCVNMKNTSYPHHSHSVLYSKLYNTIFVLSGHNQKKCEYSKLNDKGEIINWEEIIPLNTPRENPISFLLNDKYIFLIGGKNDNDNINNYNVFDFSTIYEGKISEWKNYVFKTNENNKFMFETKNPGIVDLNNNIYVFGGHNNFKEFMAWKIYFLDKYIEKIEKFKLNIFPKDKMEFSSYGQQKFILCDDYFVNINNKGKYESIPKISFI